MVILIVEPELSTRRCLNLLFKKAHDVLLCEDGIIALKHLGETPVDLVLTSERPHSLLGAELIRQGKKVSPETAFILLTASGSQEDKAAIALIESAETLSKPFDVSQVQQCLRRVEELRSLKIKGEFANHLDSLSKFLIGESRDIAEARIFINATALADSPVIIYGPNGVGKRHMARLIHESGPRAIYPFITIQCANVDADYTDAELFGYERGAFRGAQAARAGKLEFARGGTLLLEEISGLSRQSQKKLTRFLKERSFERLGSQRKIYSNVRLIALSEISLASLATQGDFDSEFLSHLNLLAFEMCGLSARREDIPLLISHFCERAQEALGRSFSLAPKTVELMTRYSFPGNAKELKMVIDHLALNSRQTTPIPPESLPMEFHQSLLEEEPQKFHSIKSSQDPAQDQTLELDWILNALEKTHNDEYQAAILLKISHQTLVEKLKYFGLQPNKKKGAKAA